MRAVISSLHWAMSAAEVVSSNSFPVCTWQREDLQPVFSFKLRGAYNKIVSSTPEQLAKGVVACSAGNHAQVCRHPIWPHVEYSREAGTYCEKMGDGRCVREQGLVVADGLVCL